MARQANYPNLFGADSRYVVYFSQMDSNELLKKRITELARRSYDRGIYENTGFLSPAEQNVFLNMQKEI